MQFTEMGRENGKTLLLLPGTACTWQVNFRNVIDELAERYHLICVNYDGFEGDSSIRFTDMESVTFKIEKYIRENHGGRVDGAYGSSLGGSFVGLLIQRKNIHIDHGFIGSSDLDQGNKITARLMTLMVGPLIAGAFKTEKKREKFKQKLSQAIGMEMTGEANDFIDGFIDSIARLHPETVKREFYSDYVTPLEDDIHVDGTTVHVIYAEKMGPKYEERYLRHFRDPDIRRFDMQHEAWLLDKKWTPQVLEYIDECMRQEPVMKYSGSRKDEIKSAYRSLGKAHSFYDGMMTGTTVAGRAVVRAVWQMDKNDILEYQAGAFEPLPSDFSGKLLEVPVGTGVISMPVWKTMPGADITCLDYSEKMMEAARERALGLGVENVGFVQGDVGVLPFEDESFDAVVSLNGFHAFPDKEAAYSETFRVLKKGGIFCGCFYVEGSNSHTDKMIKRFYIKTGFFTPPFETVESLRERLLSMYEEAEVYNVESIAVFRCRK